MILKFNNFSIFINNINLMTTSLISDSQKDFIISSIKNDFRIDGRSNK